MEVTKVNVFLLGAGWRNCTLVKVETDSGLVGWGEATLGWKEPAVRELILDYGRRYSKCAGEWGWRASSEF
jgi:L-alanine-DL-glutamate epimerase-like enolase superfamily enzyme